MIGLAGDSGSAEDDRLSEIADEFVARCDRGERPSVDEYVSRYPEFPERLRRLLETASQQNPGRHGPPGGADPGAAKGRVLGDFQLVREIDAGGMGVVYEAEQLSLNRRKVAVKLLPTAAALDPRRLLRFKNEAHAAASLQHEHIVPVYSVGCDGGQHFYAMQYIEGLTLADVITKMKGLAEQKSTALDGERVPMEPFGPNTTGTCAPRSHPGPPAPAVRDPGSDSTGADGSSRDERDTVPLSDLTSASAEQSPLFFEIIAQLGLQAAKGLDHAHQNYVVHRDIKPANLLVDRRDKLWIADFGLAQFRNEQLTLSGELLGTLRYMSPEQAMAGRAPIDRRTDIYSLGATLYELVTLEPVFNGTDRPALQKQIIEDDPVRPRKRNNRTPKDLETIILTALAKSPAHRYASAHEMAEDLQRFLNGEPIRARPEGVLRKIARKTRRHALHIALALSVIFITLMFVYLISRVTPEEQEARKRKQALAQINEKLDEKTRCDLIGAKGAPGYWRWATSETPGKILTGTDGAFTVQNWDRGLVELVPDPRLESYRVTAEVRHDRQASYESRVGVYFMHHEISDAGTTAHFHCNAAFNDLIDTNVNDTLPGHNAFELIAHCQYTVGPPHASMLPKSTIYFVPAKPVGVPGPWRRIVVEVRRDNVTIAFDRPDAVNLMRQERTVPTSDVLDAATWLNQKLRQPTNDARTLLTPRGGIGLYVWAGVASFRNVSIEPLIQ